MVLWGIPPPYNNTMEFIMFIPKKLSALFLAALLLTSSFGCTAEITGPDTKNDTAAPETFIPPVPPTPAETVSPAPAETLPPETEAETAPLLPDDAELVNDPTTGSALSDTAEEAETEDPRVYNYLNGFTATEEERARRPVAVMMNNIRNCLPQNGITQGDIYYECAAEGGITRIMMLTSDYESLGVVGSVRSSRDYFVDFLGGHDAIYVHAGGSEMAYDEIFARGINNLDGVNMYVPDMFYRDTDRMYTMGMEHSLMTTGEKIADGIAFKSYPTEHEEGFVPSFRFYDETVDNTPVGSIATHVHMDSTSVQTVDFVYDEATGEYLRYQYNGMAQVDGITGEQLSVKNVIILFTDIRLIPGDAAGRLSVTTAGSGQGYYITNGRRRVINWSRSGDDEPLRITYQADEKEVILNCGKTFVCVVDTSVAESLVFDYEW